MFLGLGKWEGWNMCWYPYKWRWHPLHLANSLPHNYSDSNIDMFNRIANFYPKSLFTYNLSRFVRKALTCVLAKILLIETEVFLLGNTKAVSSIVLSRFNSMISSGKYRLLSFFSCETLYLTPANRELFQYINVCGYT